MGLRTTYTAIKRLSADQLRPWLAEAIAAMPGAERGAAYRAVPKDYWAVHLGDTLVITDEAWILAKDAAARHGLLHLELRAQEGDHWDFTLCRAGDVVADFSTRVRYFDERRNPPRPWKRGNLAAFSEVWGVDPYVVGPYLIDWDLHRAPFRVRPTDRHNVGDVHQLFDFMPLLGIQEPQAHPDRFVVTAPTWTWSPVR